MDNQYPSSIPPYGNYYQNGPPTAYPPETYVPTLELQTFFVDDPGRDPGRYPDMDEPGSAALLPSDEQNQQPLSQQPSQRQRRRQQAGAEHVKHRRTRSGCYTCRQRRVKCDETHPVCDRCRKGKRDCTWPSTTSSPTTARREKGGESQGSASSGDEGSDEDDHQALAAIPDEGEDEGDVRQPPSAASDEPKVPTSASTAQVGASTVANRSWSGQKVSASSARVSRPQRVRVSSSKHAKAFNITQSSKWPRLPDDIRSYVRYHRDKLSHHHYAFKYDAGNFLKTTYLEIAVNDENAALLYAIVAFAAYHYAFEKQHTGISRFLQYYNQSIMLLQESLRKRRHNVATLLTILQLATIEEFLGDWVNLLGHQRAAYQLITELFTPQTIMQDETRRRIISWYIRFDLFAASMAGGGTILEREWFAAFADHYRRQVHDRPQDMGALLEECFSTIRLLSIDQTLLLAKKKQNAIDDETFGNEIATLAAQFTAFEERITGWFTDPSMFAKQFSKTKRPGEIALTDYEDPNFLYKGELFTMNFVLLDFWAIDVMFKYQISLLHRQGITPEVTELAVKMCKMFEAIEHSDEAPPGALVGCQASLGISALFLPRDKRHTDWCRLKFAIMEQNGYIYPPRLREHFSSVWNEDVRHWWLPNEEGLPPIVRSLREFVAFREQMPQDPTGADVRDMSGIFARMDMADEQSPPDHVPSTGTDSDAVEVMFDADVVWETSPEQYLHE